MLLSYGIILHRLTQIKYKIYKDGLPVCVIIVSYFYILHNYDLIFSCLNFRILYSRRHLDALFLINIFKGKINFHSIMDTVGIRVATRQMTEFSTFSVSSVLSRSPSARCVIAANDIRKFLDLFLAKTLSPLRTISRY
jgi:hypothetical protein